MNRDFLCSRRLLYTVGFSVGSLLGLPAIAHADGIDGLWFITRVGGWSANPAWSAAMLVGLMVVNYFWNVLVIGVPAAREAKLNLSKVLPGLVVFTLLGQVADRIGAITGLLLGLVLAAPLADFMGFHGEDSLGVGVLVGLALNFVFSGIAVGLLALWFLRRRCRVPGASSRALAIRAGILTNPAWAMGLWFIQRA